MNVEYRRCQSEFASGLKHPVYAGEDGSVIIFNCGAGRWEQLTQTYDLTNGYWVVSVQKSNVDNGKPRLEKDVHKLICETWRADERTATHSRVDHQNGDHNDNRTVNLRWIDALGNATKAQRQARVFDPSFSEIVIDCQRLNRGDSITDAVSVKMTNGDCAPVSDLWRYATGRPPTRLSSLIEALYRLNASKSREKTACIVDQSLIIALDGKLPFPDALVVKWAVVQPLTPNVRADRPL